MDALLLSRLQFVWVIAWHILLPAFTVGLACCIATLEVLWWWKKDDVYRRLSAYWIKIFAVSFGMGVVSGIVMPFQFGTNREPLLRRRRQRHRLADGPTRC